MEAELLLLLGVCLAGLAVTVLVLFKSADFVQLGVFGGRSRQSRRLAQQIGRMLAVSQNSLYAKSRQLEELAARLEGANLTLEEMNNMKSKFFSMVVHDVRTPLAAIRGYSQMFGMSSANERHRKMSQQMALAVDRLNLLVSDLTDVAMIEAGKLTMNMAGFTFGELVAELMASVEITARNKGVRLRYDRITPGAVINGDKFRISQVLQNLLNNAIKFTPAGGTVELTSRVEGKFLAVGVRDSGIGIHPSETKRIFEKFYQAKYQKDEKLRKQGWGLGLSIAHEIIMRHKGRIWADSPGLGKGSTFWFKAPAGFSAAGHN